MFRVAFNAGSRASLAAVGTAGCAGFVYKNHSNAFVSSGFNACHCASESHAPLIMVGPSGVGKGTLIKLMMEKYPNQFGFCVSTTTRKPRPGEVDGKDYHFSEKEPMQKQIDEGKFVEHANVHTNIYGTSFAALDAVKQANQIAILDIDVQGAKNVKPKIAGAIFMFLAPPSVQILEQRLRGRGTETEDKVQVRLKNAIGEIEFSKTPGFFDKVLVADDGFDKAFPELKAWLEENYPQLKVAKL